MNQALAAMAVASALAMPSYAYGTRGGVKIPRYVSPEERAEIKARRKLRKAERQRRKNNRK